MPKKHTPTDPQMNQELDSIYEKLDKVIVSVDQPKNARDATIWINPEGPAMYVFWRGQFVAL